jgi:tetratricopeptide (TPR) repeat protein
MGFYYPDPDNLWIPPRDATALMGPLTQQALEIDPTLAEAHAAMGFIHAFALRWVDAEKSFRRAIELDPSLTTAYGDFVLSTLIPWGRLDDALRTLETALQVDPLSLDMRIVMAGVQGSAGLYADALDNYRRVLDVDPNLPDWVRLFRAWALFFNGDRAAALDWFEEFSDGGRREGVKGWIHAINGRRKEAEDIAARFSHIPSRQAEIYGLLGDKDRALEALERLAVMNPMLAGFQLVQPAVGLRDDPRAEAFRRKLGFPQ